MTQHIELGKMGEDLAEVFLSGKGFKIKHRNWRHSHYEVDIIAEKDGVPHFIEVKTRTSTHFGQPEESITKKKIGDLLRAADAFMRYHPSFSDFRIDVLSIVHQTGKEPEYFFIEDVYC